VARVVASAMAWVPASATTKTIGAATAPRCGVIDIQLPPG
jgi:hypothetical protein